jgi:hypothetical protein
MNLDLPMFNGNLLCFGLTQVATERGRYLSECALTDGARLLDVIIGWLQAQANDQALKERTKSSAWEDRVSTLRFKLVFKAKLFFYHLLKRGVLGNDGVNLYYQQCVCDIVTGIYPCTKEDAIYLAALQLHADLGQDAQPLAIAPMLDQFLPMKHLRVLRGEDEKKKPAKDQKFDLAANMTVANRLLMERAKYNGLDKLEAKRLYLDQCLKLPHYGALFFTVILQWDAKIGDWDFEEMCMKNLKKNTNTVKNPTEYAVGISEKGILFCDKQTKVLKRHDKLSRVPSHGYNGEYFWYTLGDPKLAQDKADSQRIVVFKTNLGKVMDSLFATYKLAAHNALEF